MYKTLAEAASSADYLYNKSKIYQSNLRHRVDFRSIYAAVLKDWLGADDAAISGTGFERMSGLV